MCRPTISERNLAPNEAYTQSTSPIFSILPQYNAQMKPIFAAVSLVLVISGCASQGVPEGSSSNSPSLSPSVTPSNTPAFDIEITTELAVFQPALQEYLAGLMSIGKLETKVMSDFSDAFTEGVAINAKLEKASKSIADDAIDFTADLAALQVSTPEIEYFQSEYIKIWETKRDIMVQLSEAIAQSDTTRVESLLLEFQKVQSQIRPLRTLLDKFMSYANIGAPTN